MTRILHFALACLLAVPAAAQVNYAVGDGTAYVAESPNASGDVVIASTYNGYPVTRIGERAFFGCTNLTSVTFPNSVTDIGDWAFLGCSSLTNPAIGNSVTDIGDRAFWGCTSLITVTIPNSVVSIGEQAFSYCTNVASATIPSSVTSLGDWAFQSCTSLTNITVAADNPAYSSIGGVLFNKAQTTLIQFPGGRGGDYVIPNGVTTVDSGAFSMCISVTSVTLPSSVTTLHYSTHFFSSYRPFPPFIGCNNLTSLTFLGNAPHEGYPFSGAGVAVYYYYGTTGWGPTFLGFPTVMLGAPPPQISPVNVGAQPGGFGFTLSGVTHQTIVVEASTNLVHWQPIWSNTLSAASASFTDPQWLDHPNRFYRARSN